MREGMWFGTRGNMRWVKNVAPDAGFARIGWSAKMQYLNGGARMRKSKASHMEYNMVWNPTATRAELQPIMDYAAGVYDTSDSTELIYFISPEAADRNVLNSSWSFPGQSDAMPLLRGKSPTLVPTDTNTLDYPARSAQYAVTGSDVPVSFYVPVPPGYTAWVGVHGSESGSSGVRVTPYSGVSVGTPVDLTFLPVTSSTRVNESFDSADCTGIEIALIAASGTVTLSGMIVQILRTGATPEVGGFISGLGHSGCAFDGDPAATYYLLGENREAMGMTARLVEVGAWL